MAARVRLTARRAGSASRWGAAVAIAQGVALASALVLGVAVGLPQPAAARLGKEAAGSPPSVQQGSPITPTWYALALGRIQGRLAVAHYWSFGEKFRAMTLINGRPILTIVNGPYYYTIDVSAGTGVRIERSPNSTARDGRYSRPFADEWEELVAAGGEKVSEETISGRLTEVWRLTNESGRRTVYVAPEKPMVPSRVETYDRKTGRRDSVDYVNWQLGLAISEDFFEPPSDVQFQQFDYEAYVAAARKGPVGSVPPLYRRLLHGERQ